MRIFIDTNILLYRVNQDFPEHMKTKKCLDSLIEKHTLFCLSYGVIYEFLRVSTHPRVFSKPLSSKNAFSFISQFFETVSISFLSPTDRHFEVLKQTLSELHLPMGNLFHDIHSAILMRENDVREIMTADHDFLQFKFLKVINPLV